jgi:alkanesulfonate monooxygenase SsuD/methylene tetrahydromethanopterin reductase-like flavin-dependent oxidoreductase (luciferase family)
MKIALFAVNVGPCAAPDTLARVARAAEDAGLESLWTGEHVVLPDPQAPPSPMAPDVPILDPAVALTFAAAHTTRIRLGTGIIILPQRNPLVLAKELASLDVLSNGRLVFGIGVGYLKPEFDALNVPFDHKGARAEEFLRAMLAVWTMEKPASTAASSTSPGCARSRGRRSARIRRSSSAGTRPRRSAGRRASRAAGTASPSTTTARGRASRGSAPRAGTSAAASRTSR